MKKLAIILGLLLIISGCNGQPKTSISNQETNQAVGIQDQAKEIFILRIDDQIFEIEAIKKELYTVFEILDLYSKKENVILKVKDYPFGKFIEGIGDKIGGKDRFWLFYVNGKLANSSADKTEIKAGDIIKFEFTSTNPF